MKLRLKKRSHKKNVLAISACNPKKYKTFPVLFFGLGIGSTIGDESHLVEHEIASPTEDVHLRESLVSSTHCWIDYEMLLLYIWKIDKRIYVYRPMVCVPDRIFTYFRCLRCKFICIMLQLVFWNTLDYEEICRFQNKNKNKPS